jgi:hypothetical protein
MSYELNTSIHIQASPATIWNILLDFPQYPRWNPFITSISGQTKVGSQLNVTLQGMTFKPTVLTYTAQREFKWLGSLWFKGLFDGAHRFYLQEEADGSTYFEQSEIFKGILVPIFTKKMLPQTKVSFEEMNRALKQRAEALEAKQQIHP